MWNRKLEKNRFGPTMIYRWNVRARSRFSGEGKMGHSSSLELMHDDDSWHSTHAPTKDICRRASSGLAIVNIQRQLMCGTAWMNDERAMITHAGPRFLHCFYYLFILFFHIWSMSSIGRWIIELQECGNIISMFLSPVTIAAAISILNSSLRSSTGSVDENIQFFSLISEKKKELRRSTYMMRHIEVASSINQVVVIVDDGLRAATAALTSRMWQWQWHRTIASVAMRARGMIDHQPKWPGAISSRKHMEIPNAWQWPSLLRMKSHDLL